MPMGEAIGSSKLTEAQVLAIYSDKRRQVDIAAEYECAQSLVSRIKRGEAWGHVTAQKQNKPKPRLTPQVVIQIRADARSVADVAAAHGVSASTVKKIRGRKAWAGLIDA
jgi:hypothetical protein